MIGRLHRLAAVLHEELATVYRRHGLGDGELDVLATLRRAGRPYALQAGELTALARTLEAPGPDQGGSTEPL